MLAAEDDWTGALERAGFSVEAADGEAVVRYRVPGRRDERAVRGDRPCAGKRAADGSVVPPRLADAGVRAEDDPVPHLPVLQ